MNIPVKNERGIRHRQALSIFDLWLQNHIRFDKPIVTVNTEAIIVPNMNILGNKMKAEFVLWTAGHILTDFKVMWPLLKGHIGYFNRVISTSHRKSLWQIGTSYVKKYERGLNVTNHKTAVSLCDFHLWLKDHITDLNNLLSSTPPRQLVCIIWTFIFGQKRMRISLYEPKDSFWQI